MRIRCEFELVRIPSSSNRHPYDGVRAEEVLRVGTLAPLAIPRREEVLV